MWGKNCNRMQDKHLTNSKLHETRTTSRHSCLITARKSRRFKGYTQAQHQTYIVDPNLVQKVTVFRKVQAPNQKEDSPGRSLKLCVLTIPRTNSP